jgi:hypothetical protein
MYLPASKYKILYSRGEILNSDGTPYNGPYIKTYDSRYFQGDNIDSPGPSLIGPPPPPPRPRPDPLPPVQGPGGLFTPQGRLAFQDRYQTVEDLFHTLYLPPTEQDYTNTGFTRYVVQDRSTRQMVETNQSRYIQLLREGYIGVEVPWKILGPLNNILFNRTLIRGTTQQNLQTLKRVESFIPEIQQFLNNPGQYTRTPERVEAIELATGNKVVLRTSDFVLIGVTPDVPVDTTTYVLPGYVVVGYVI